MKQILVAMVIGFVFCGCTRFCGGLAGGAVGTSAGYELNAHQQMEKLDDDLKAWAHRPKGI